MADLYKDIFFRNIRGDLSRTQNQSLEGRHRACYIALSYANEKKLDEAKKALAHHSDVNHYCSITLEAKALVAYYSRNNKDAQKLANEALQLNKKTVFAYVVLAGIALQEKQKTKAIDYYKKILSIYPDHSGILLNMADILHEKKETLSLAQEYVDRASPSIRRSLSQLVLFISSMRGRFLWFIPVILILITPGVGMWFYIVTTILVLLGTVWSARQGYMLISSRLLAIQFMHTFFGVIILFLKWLINLTS